MSRCLAEATAVAGRPAFPVHRPEAQPDAQCWMKTQHRLRLGLYHNALIKKSIECLISIMHNPFLAGQKHSGTLIIPV